jgi:hypothetical protein
MSSDGHYHGFVRSADGQTYTTINVPSSTQTYAFGINNTGQVTGYYKDSGNVTHGFIATPVPEPPPAATLISPSGTIATTTPTYTWNAVASATQYSLYVTDSATSGKIQTSYTAAQAGCPTGTGTCSVTPSTALATGNGQWWIQTWNAAGYGPWSSGMTFTVNLAPPGKATLISPSGAGSAATPIYTWNAVPGATWYEIWVNDSAQSRKMDIWYTAAGVGCPAGTGTCVVAPSIPLAAGSATWWIQCWGPSGYGTWSNGMAFTVSQPSTMATLVSPSGTIHTTTPTYTWNAVPGMTWYFLWVDDTSKGGKVQQWLAASTAGCGSGTGTCSYTPTTALALGAATWWIEGWSPAGYGPWSNGLSFTVAP